LKKGGAVPDKGAAPFLVGCVGKRRAWSETDLE
jgi:hypothetical protein